MLKKSYTILLILLLPIISKSQSHPGVQAFTKFVSKNYRLPEELKSNCEWMYAIVKVKTDNHNRIIKYEFVNKPTEGMKKPFDFLIGYQFPKATKINGHPIIFYLGIDNLEICKEKPGDKVFYAPNDVVSTITSYMQKILRDDPKTIFVPNLVFIGYPPSQR
ncbi:hypothetical protein [Mucilaginibacter sp. AK015]|uniref:hypothetical protein n=1 Tax=Mucilaginibacter sp. AK015 TaxID=2723072 RepID=UPI00161B7D6D|nr:hypothetical protein [Mucilaginibacter sp. AK015]MBB5396351.1 hypothetical protein [Mucilaginibacter sp. AK015]